jgi:hypothetical protein
MELLEKIEDLEKDIDKLCKECPGIEHTIARQYTRSIQDWVIRAQEKGEK